MVAKSTERNRDRCRSKSPAPSSAAARRRMIATRRVDTTPELKLRSELHRMGLRFRLHQHVLLPIRRQVDIALGSSRVAVFVDGCFWHGCPLHGTMAKAN